MAEQPTISIDAHSAHPAFGSEVVGMLLQAMRESPAPMLLTEPDGCILKVNEAFECATGYAMDELVGRSPGMLRSGLQGRSFYSTMWASLGSQGRWQGEIWNRRKDGQLSQEYLTIVTLRGSDGVAAYHLGTYAEQASQQMGSGRARRDAATDATTGLLSRKAFTEAADLLSEKAPLVHVLALDIDGFTELNELHGLVSGDAVLRQMALRCTEVAAADGRPAVVARVGPDEFAIALADPHAGGGDAVQSFASRLYAKTALPFDLGEGKHIQISVSVGLSSLAQGCASAAEALLHASAARQEAVPGLPMLQCYEAQDGQRRMALALRDAVRLEQITVAYQPKVNLASGQLSGVEALARWVLPDGSSVSPAEFIPLAERRGLIGLIGDSVMEQALAQLAAWQTMGLAAPVVAVNFSALQFQRQNYVQHVALALDRHGIPARLLEIELTESLLFGDIDAVMQSLQSFRNLGVALSIDDFGTGYSSLAYLRRFPVQYLKIDRQFVSAMGDDASACEIVRLIVDMAHRLNLRCIAEGIETEAQLKLLQSMGCDEGQGFLLARPLDTGAMQAVLAGRVPWAALFESVPVESVQVDMDQGANGGCKPQSPTARCNGDVANVPFPEGPFQDMRAVADISGAAFLCPREAAQGPGLLRSGMCQAG